MDQQMYHDQVMMEKQMMEVNKYITEGSKMGVYKKLMQARLELQETNLTKSGHNKFAGYKYFELGDFLPAIQKIFAELELCGIVSFGQELATLTITGTPQTNPGFVDSWIEVWQGLNKLRADDDGAHSATNVLASIIRMPLTAGEYFWR